MTKKAEAMVLYEPNGEFKQETVELDDLRNDEVLVRIEACGICHTDIMAKGMVPKPAVLGHEGAGIVEAVGKGVSRVKPGDRVIISYPWCGTCPNCIEGRANICEDFAPLSFSCSRSDFSKTMTLKGDAISGAFFQQSSFATHSITLERDVVPVTGDHASEMLAAIPCGVQTGAGTVINTFKAGPRDSLAVFGVGTVGLSAIMAGHMSGVSPIIAVDINDERLNLALELGATHALNAIEGNTAGRIRDISPVKYSLDTSGIEQSFKDGIDCLKIGGTIGMVAGFRAPFPFLPNTLAMKGASLEAIIQGSSLPNTFLPMIMELNRQGRFPYERLITTYAFEDINNAFEDLKTGKAVKPVLKMT